MSTPSRYPLFSRSLLDGIAAGVIALGICAILVSCDNRVEEIKERHTAKTHSKEIIPYVGYVYTFTFEGHLFIGTNGSGTPCIIHHPSCPCAQRAAP